MVKIAIVGIGGFGAAYLHAVSVLEREGSACLAAVADTRLEAFPEQVATLREHGVALFPSHTALMDSGIAVDLMTMPLPIFLHAPLTIECLHRGKHVLVEKPPAATLAQAVAMRDAALASGKHCGVGFQLSTSRWVSTVRDLVARGALGRLTRVAALCLGERDDAYYARSPWAGKLRLGDTVVRDGSMNNPIAHYLHLLLRVAGAVDGRATAHPVAVEAELYAGHRIDTEDTHTLRAELDCGATLHFTGSMCSPGEAYYAVRIEGTAGSITLQVFPESPTVADFPGAEGMEFPPIMEEDGPGTTTAIFRNYVDVLDGRAPALACSIEDTLGFAEVVEMAFNGERITPLWNTAHIERSVNTLPDGRESHLTHLRGIASYGREAFASGALFSELGAPWAVAPQRVTLDAVMR
jgi:predicted dehydrogenase